MKLVLAIALLSGCTAIDRFSQFRFGDGGAGNDMALVDLMSPGPTPFGGPCAMMSDCQQYNDMRAVNCVMAAGNQTFPGGMCTRQCSGGGSCTDYGGVGLGATCVSIGNGVMECLPRCLKATPNCRPSYNCCAMGAVPGEGVCAPPSFMPCM